MFPPGASAPPQLIVIARVASLKAGKVPLITPKRSDFEEANIEHSVAALKTAVYQDMRRPRLRA
jgi:hypothetical protein